MSVTLKRPFSTARFENSRLVKFMLITAAILVFFSLVFLYANATLSHTLLPTSVNANVSSFYNIVFPFVLIFVLITSLTLYFCFAYNEVELKSFTLFVCVIFICGLGLFSTTSLFLFFCFYEGLLLPSFFILYLFAKTRKAVEAAYLMFF